LVAKNTAVEFVKIFNHKLQSRLLGSALLLPLIPIGLWLFANRWPYPRIFPSVFGLTGWQIFQQFGGLSAIVISLAISFFVALLAVPIALVVVFYLGADRQNSHPFLELILFSPVFIPPFVLVMGVSVASITLGIPEFLATVLTLTTLALPYAIYVIRAGYRNYDSRWDDIGQLLGLNSRLTVFRVRLPILFKPISAATLMALLSDYIVTVIVGGGRVNSLPMLLAGLATSAGNDSALSMIAAVGIAIPVLLLLVIKFSFNLGNHKSL
jgi:putative spermidine/putrescine transport system permease protein